MVLALPRHPSPLAALLLVPLALAGCSQGDNDDDEFTSVAPAGPSSGGESSSGPGAPTTGAPVDTSSGGDAPTGSTTADATTTTTTTGDATTGDDTTGTTGPICEPGAGNCVCDDGACDDGFTCQDGVCLAPMECPGDLEPGDGAEDSATDVGSITDDDSEKFTISGVLSGASDVDWYTYHGKDTFGYVAEPTLSELSGALRLCHFLACDNGGAAQTELECPEGTKLALSPQLRPGCCAETTFAIKTFNCPGNDESARMWIRVDKAAVDACTNYSFKVNF